MTSSPEGFLKALRAAQVILETIGFLVAAGGAVAFFLIFREAGKAYLLAISVVLALCAIALLVAIVGTLRSPQR
jgi:hypothetical protein